MGYSIYVMEETRDRIRDRAKALGANEEQFREQLFGLREAHNLTQEQVADRMGVSQSVIARLEGYDSNPTLSTLRRYALAVGALLEFTATSDDVAYVAAGGLAPTVLQTAPVATTPAVNWGSRRAAAHA